jgi:hypothetical protein
VLFYGSCLRKETNEGVLDFWVVVEDYARAYTDRGLRGRCLALVNRIAAPNVFYLEREFEGETLRTKFGVIDRKGFERGTSLGAKHPYVWARFAQPARLIGCRDADARTFFEHAIAEAVLSMVGRLVCFLPASSGWIRFTVGAFWKRAFALTYASERRPEAAESIQALYLADVDRYDAIAGLAIRILTERGHFEAVTRHPRAFQVQLSARRRTLQRLRWRSMRSYARTLGLVRLFKTAWTFGDWVPYALWKLERHTGKPIATTEAQRRHPFVFGWPIILRFVFKRDLS